MWLLSYYHQNCIVYETYSFNHIWVQQYQTCIRNHIHMQSSIWSLLKSVITAMSSQLADVMSPAETRPAVLKQPATTEKSDMSSQFKMIRLMRDLKDLLLLKNAELYCKLWQELKLKMLKSLKMTCVTADNTHIVKLINAVKVMISKQKQQATAFMKAISFMMTL